MTLTTQSALRKDQMNAGSRLEHRHFATIAAILAKLKPAKVEDDHVHSFYERTLETFADALAHTNPRFDRERFLRACGEI